MDIELRTLNYLPQSIEVEAGIKGVIYFKLEDIKKLLDDTLELNPYLKYWNKFYLVQINNEDYLTRGGVFRLLFEYHGTGDIGVVLKHFIIFLDKYDEAVFAKALRLEEVLKVVNNMTEPQAVN